MCFNTGTGETANCREKQSHSLPKPQLSPFLSGFTAEPTDNASVSVVTYKGDYYVSTETNFMHRVNPESLETVEKVRTWGVGTYSQSVCCLVEVGGELGLCR